MSVAEVAGLEGVGAGVNGLIRLWKSVEKPKAARPNSVGAKDLVIRGPG
jgi:hypothetical protein